MSKSISDVSELASSTVDEKSVVLERIRRVATEKLSSTQAKFDIEELPRIGDYIGYRLVTGVLGEEVDKQDLDIYFYYPATWWEHFKKTYFKGWLLEKFPVKMATEKKIAHFKKYATYPELPEIHPNTGKIVYRSMMWSQNG